MARTSATPKPVVIQTVCSLCGLDWEQHPENASALDCIELLKAEAATPKPVTVPWKPWRPGEPYREPTWTISESPGMLTTKSGTHIEGTGKACRL